MSAIPGDSGDLGIGLPGPDLDQGLGDSLGDELVLPRGVGTITTLYGPLAVDALTGPGLLPRQHFGEGVGLLLALLPSRPLTRIAAVALAPVARSSVRAVELDSG